MNEWSSWCNLCGNVDALSEIDQEVKDTILSVFQLSVNHICSECHEFMLSFVNFFKKVLNVQDMLDDLNKRNLSDINQIISIRESYLNNVEIIESVECLDREIELKIQYEEEVSVIETEEEYICDKSQMVNNDETSYDKHDEIKTKHTCELCGKNFKEQRSKGHLAVHMNSHLPDEEKFVNQCEYCNKKYSSIYSLRQHIKCVHINEKIWSCSMCDKKFSRKANLDSHMNVHTSDRKFDCDLCGLKLKTKANLRNHKKIHSTDPESFLSCKVCDRQFKTHNQLTNHMVVHSDEKRHVCDKCNASYKRSKELQNHMNSVHLNIKKLHCPWCDKAFVNNSNFRKHKKNSHARELEMYEKSKFGVGENYIVEELE